MSAFKDITGQRFGRLVVLERSKNNANGGTTWRCRCDCGAESIVFKGHLTSGHTTSCGCAHKEQLIARNITHGCADDPTYVSWVNMKSRCNNKNRPDYSYYGGRGITYDPKWELFENFLKDMGTKPAESPTIERIDNEGNYCKENCKWASWKEQANNRSNSVRITYDGESHSISQWANKIGISVVTIRKRLKKGLPLKVVLSNNNRTYKLVSFQEKTMNLSQWEKHLGFKRGILKARLSAGWSEEEALSTPPGHMRHTR